MRLFDKVCGVCSSDPEVEDGQTTEDSSHSWIENT